MWVRPLDDSTLYQLLPRDAQRYIAQGTHLGNKVYLTVMQLWLTDEGTLNGSPATVGVYLADMLTDHYGCAYPTALELACKYTAVLVNYETMRILSARNGN